MLPIEFHPDAEVELTDAKTWYANAGPDVLERFATEINHALAQIEAHPNRWPKYSKTDRLFLLRHFPYVVAYRVYPDLIRILAVSHTSRKPGYWANR